MSGYAEFARLTATPLDRAVDKAIKDINDDYVTLLNDHACEEHRTSMLEMDGSHKDRCRVCYTALS